MEFLTEDINEIYLRVVERFRSEALTGQESYFETADEILEEMREAGELPDDYNFAQAREALRSRWSEIERAGL